MSSSRENRKGVVQEHLAYFWASSQVQISTNHLNRELIDILMYSTGASLHFKGVYKQVQASPQLSMQDSNLEEIPQDLGLRLVLHGDQ